MIWKDKRDINMLTNLHYPPGEGNFYDEHVNTLKLAIVQDYNRRMVYVGKRYCMTNSLSADRPKVGGGGTIFSCTGLDDIEQLHSPHHLQNKIN
jgi:hypothetical protein